MCAHAYTMLDGILYLAMRYYTSYLDLYPNLTAPSFNSPVRFFVHLASTNKKDRSSMVVDISQPKYDIRPQSI